MKELTLNQIHQTNGGGPKEYLWEDIGCRGGDDGMSCEFTLGQLFDGFNDLGTMIGNGLYDLFNN